MDAVIRKAEAKDVPEIVENWKELIQGNVRYERVLCRLVPDNVQIYRKYLRKQIAARKARVFVADADGKIIGHVMVEVKKIPPCYEIGNEAYVGELFVKGKFRGKKIGTRLLGAAEEWAKKRGVRQFSLTVHVKNGRAKRVYKSFGLREFNFKLVKIIG